jgi:23S rRNA (guanosine2251-2'-O)-methyltransferase
LESIGKSDTEVKMKENEMVFGIRAVIEAVQAGKEIDKVLLRKELQGELSRELFAVLKGRDIPVQRVPAERLDRLTRKNHQGVIAFIPAVVYQRLEEIIPFVYEQGRDPFIVLLDGITDVRNFGAIARTCECAGVDAIVIPAQGSVTVNADAIKTSAGALHTLPVCKEKSIRGAIRFLQQSGVQVFAATEKAAGAYTEASYNVPAALVIGAEDTGVSMENLRICDRMVRIPLFGAIKSLNVSVAASIILYEAIRQKQTSNR